MDFSDPPVKCSHLLHFDGPALLLIVPCGWRGPKSRVWPGVPIGMQHRAQSRHTHGQTLSDGQKLVLDQPWSRAEETELGRGTQKSGVYRGRRGTLRAPGDFCDPCTNSLGV